MNKYIIFFLAALSLSACEEVRTVFSSAKDITASKGKALARVHDKVLYEKDLAGIMDLTVASEADSTLVKRYVNSWVRKELLLHEAEENMEMDEAELERKIEEYKFQLLAYAYEQKYVAENLDTLVTEEELEKYYGENEKEFVLKSNIVRGVFLKFPEETPNLDKLEQWMKDDGDASMAKIRSLALSYADFAYTNDDSWMELDELLFGTPFMKTTSDQLQMLKRKRFWKTEDGGYAYFFYIREYKIVDQVSPLEFVRDQVEAVILNRRKVRLSTNLSKDLYQKATINEDYEIFN
ncbi:peptidyl-prolyl cis-trans isomerase [Algivirga pacifica]|uniref:Peptidyl-prolyl cis-trans isomerase n=1 Tax=Algivirga pacifica TaxID=1162670 RepID=A0ABP9DAT8_9BACT